MKNIDDLLEQIIKKPIARLGTYMLDIRIYAHSTVIKLFEGQIDRRYGFEIPKEINCVVDVVLTDPISKEVQHFEKMNLKYDNPGGKTRLNIPLLWVDNTEVRLEIYNNTWGTKTEYILKKYEALDLPREERGELTFIWREVETNEIIVKQKRYVDPNCEGFRLSFPHHLAYEND